MARPLSKTKDDGTRYTRFPAIEAAINQALGQGLDTLRDRARIRDPRAPGYLPSESLLHLIREAGRRGDDRSRNGLLPLLLERCHANLNNKVDDDIPNAERLRRDILNEFGELFAIDGSPDDKLALDFFEVRFNLAFKNFRIDRVRAVLDEHRMQVALAEDESETAEQELDNEVLARLADLRGDGNPEDSVFRKQIIAAIKALPEDERKAVLLVHYYGYKIESNDPNEITAATLCGVRGRTIQNRLTRAIQKLSKLKENA
jgi:hypothetical protein